MDWLCGSSRAMNPALGSREGSSIWRSGAKALHDRAHDARQRIGVAAAMEDRACLRREPADERPVRDLTLGDEAHRPLAVHELDVEP